MKYIIKIYIPNHMDDKIHYIGLFDDESEAVEYASNLIEKEKSYGEFIVIEMSEKNGG